MKLREYDKKDWLRVAKNVGLTVLGSLVLAFGAAIFILPFSLISGGMPGMAIVLNRLIPLAFFTEDVIVTILTWVLFFVGFAVLGRSFAAKTLISAIVYPLGISLFLKLSDPNVLGGFFYMPGAEHGQISFLLAALFGGVFVGAGCALTFLGGGSTGGTDIIAFTICKIFPRLKSSVVIFAVDAVIVISGMFIVGDLVLSLLGILSAFIASAVIDKVFLGGSQALIAEIISDEYAAINRDVIEKLQRTTTIFDTTGGYTGKPKKMLSVCCTMREYADLVGIVNRHDKNAFMTVHRAHEISGEGWTREKGTRL